LKSKKLDTLIEDIYDVLDKLNTDEGIDIDEDLLEDFLVGVRGAIKSWSTPKLQNKALRILLPLLSFFMVIC
jgi:hypothetical protein